MNCINCKISISDQNHRCPDCKLMHNRKLQKQGRNSRTNQIRQCPGCNIRHKSPGYCGERCKSCHNKHTLKYSHAYDKRHPGRKLASRKKYIKANKEKVSEYNLNWFKTHPDKAIEYNRKFKEKVKYETVIAYGGKCSCLKCPESRIEFLTIDHKNGGGNKHRKSLGMKSGGAPFYSWLRRQGFPKDEYQLLCRNCNNGKSEYGVCPHMFTKSMKPTYGMSKH